MNLPVTQTFRPYAPAQAALDVLCDARNDSQSKTLGSSEGFDERQRRPHPVSDAGPQACQNGTGEFAPLWNGPRLRPVFVAQVLGQVMMDHRQQTSSLSRAAYLSGPAILSPAMFFNDSV